MKTFSVLLLALLFSLTAFNCRKSGNQLKGPLPDADLDFRELNHDLNQPWEILWGPDNMLWLTERGGRVSRVNPSTGSLTPLITISEVESRGEGGLLGMALHPDFTNVPQVFLAYNYVKSGVYTEKIVRFTYNGTSLINPVILLDNIRANTFHNGCRLLVSPDHKLFFSTGDAGNAAEAQNKNSLNGKILRLNLDGSVPADNPFPGNPVWSFGHRNAQGLVMAHGIFYSSEHGPDSDDEFNIIRKGENYGWPNVRGFCNESAERSFCNAQNVAEPLKAWTPTIAVCGIDYYDKDQIPQWKNSILMCTLKDQTLYQLKLDASGDKIMETKELIRGTYGRLRDVCVAPDGRVFLISGNGQGDKIIVISKK